MSLRTRPVTLTLVRSRGLLVNPVHIEDAVRACDVVDPDVMFPRSEKLEAYEPAKAVCRRCSLLDLCGEWAVRSAEPKGCWGATTPDERRADPRWGTAR